MKDITPPAPQPGEIALKTSTPSSATRPESWVQLVDEPVVLVAQNVLTPTFAPLLPALDKATGAAMIIATGGGFLMLSMESEAWALARWLQSKGIAAFVLKCRLEPAEPGAAGLLHSLTRLTNGVDGPEFKPTLVNGMQLATEDAREAMRSMNIASRLRSLDCALVQGATDTLHLVLALRIASAHLCLNSAWRSLQVARGSVPSREVEI